MTRVDAARKRLGVSFLPIVARATIETLRDTRRSTRRSTARRTRGTTAVNLGIAVALDEAA